LYMYICKKKRWIINHYHKLDTPRSL
jgi:hypothetical protein